MSIVSTACAFSVIQCVTKRTRQLERLLAQVQSKYAKMLLDFLEKEQGLDISVLFKGSIHLESYHEELQQLLVLVEEEKLLRQRVAGTWDFIAAKSIDQNSVTLIRACENLWNDLLPQISIVLPLINSIRGEPDSPSWLGSTDIPSAVHPWPSIVH
ncbi:hypothetical protein PPTG_05740 [Phytophthora nicotianae INRA-310]|uniref:Uncharacterized protein n=1 Tax=Phytophthora nicotianae (strain INRA-310) TaxID=761204 RepID=W2QWA7_PHYN3|nr:hypothetical protein PPTG_05740 [Phytophthora nicotianae INRA-310]ETN16555.1 hypothetical protein PPTG_05740 [Phytophthora nicotianae INRA-310]